MLPDELGPGAIRLPVELRCAPEPCTWSGDDGRTFSGVLFGYLVMVETGELDAPR